MARRMVPGYQLYPLGHSTPAPARLGIQKQPCRLGRAKVQMMAGGGPNTWVS